MDKHTYLLIIKLLRFILRSTWDSVSQFEYHELMKQCDKIVKEDFGYTHDWSCGCGHWNGSNLGNCAMCGRSPNESLPSKMTVGGVNV